MPRRHVGTARTSRQSRAVPTKTAARENPRRELRRFRRYIIFVWMLLLYSYVNIQLSWMTSMYLARPWCMFHLRFVFTKLLISGSFVRHRWRYNFEKRDRSYYALVYYEVYWKLICRCVGFYPTDPCWTTCYYILFTLTLPTINFCQIWLYIISLHFHYIGISLYWNFIIVNFQYIEISLYWNFTILKFHYIKISLY